MRDDERPRVEASPHGSPLDTEDPRRWLGQRIAGRYRADELLGSGASGFTLRCHLVELDLDVAVKVLFGELSQHPAAITGFLALAQATSALDHPNCVKVLDFGQWQRDDGPPLLYAATPYVDGGSLRGLIANPLEPRRAIELTRQVLDGLAHAHARGVVHGHLSPDNVLVARRQNGQLLELVDFGLARIAEQARQNLPAQGRPRKLPLPHYASPEHGAGTELEPRSDLYSVGVLLYQMLTGRTPYENDDPARLLGMHAFADPAPLPATLPEPLRGLVARILAKRPDDRPPSALELARELDVVANLFSGRRTMQFGSYAMASLARSIEPVVAGEIAAQLVPMRRPTPRHGAPDGAGGQPTAAAPSAPVVEPRPDPTPEMDAPEAPAAHVPSFVHASASPPTEHRPPRVIVRPRQQTEFDRATMELRSATARLPDFGDVDTQPDLRNRRRKVPWAALGAATATFVGVVVWATSGTEETVRASSAADFEAVRGVIAERFGEESAVDPAAPAPFPPRAPRAGLKTELIEVDGLLKKGLDQAAMARIDRMLRENPEDGRVHLRRARALALRPQDGARALAAYEDALSRDPKQLEDKEIRDEIVRLVRRPDLRAPALELVLHQFGDQRDPMLVELVNDGTTPLGYRDRHRALAAITRDSTAAPQVNRVLATTLDLWQANETENGCLVFASALATIEREPAAAYLGTLHRVKPPVAAPDADPNTFALCSVLPARLEAVKKTVSAKFPGSSSSWSVPPAYAQPTPTTTAASGPGAHADAHAGSPNVPTPLDPHSVTARVDATPRGS